MNPIYRKTTVAIFAFLFANAAIAQTPKPAVVNATGQKIQNASFQLTYSVGEPLVTVISTPNDILTQGFIQPDVASKADAFNYYPNPVIDELVLENVRRVTSYKVYDLVGREVLGGRIDRSRRRFVINLSSLTEAGYIVNTYDQANKRLHSFQVVKR